MLQLICPYLSQSNHFTMVEDVLYVACEKYLENF